jgi:hypothetical protein
LTTLQGFVSFLSANVLSTDSHKFSQIKRDLIENEKNAETFLWIAAQFYFILGLAFNPKKSVQICVNLWIKSQPAFKLFLFFFSLCRKTSFSLQPLAFSV